jgi:molybdopterin adenylyltransferase
VTTPLKTGVITASDRSHRGEREDKSGLLLRDLLLNIPAEVILYKIVPDDRQLLAAALIVGADHLHCDIILTTGGTGLAPRDHTPEATRDVIDKEVPGIVQAIREASLRKTPMAMLSRAVAGIRGRTLIVNLPGSPSGVREAFEVISPVLQHAVELIHGEVKDCQKSSLSPHSHS